MKQLAGRPGTGRMAKQRHAIRPAGPREGRGRAGGALRASRGRRRCLPSRCRGHVAETACDRVVCFPIQPPALPARTPGDRPGQDEETSTASTVRTNRRRRLRLAVAGAVVLTTLTAATAGAALPPADGEAATAAPPQRAANPGHRQRHWLERHCRQLRHQGRRHRRQAPQPDAGFLLKRGRCTTIAAPGAVTTVPGDINNRGQVVGFASTDGTTARGFLLARASTDPSPRSASPARPAPWRSASTTAGRSPAPTAAVPDPTKEAETATGNRPHPHARWSRRPAVMPTPSGTCQTPTEQEHAPHPWRWS